MTEFVPLGQDNQRIGPGQRLVIRAMVSHAIAEQPSRILERLGQVGEESVTDLAQHLRMSQPRISWHLRMLRVGGVVRTRRDGRQVYCSLDVENIGRERARLDQLLGIQDKLKVREEVGA